MSIALRFEGGVDGPRELSLEAADRFASAFAFALFAFEVGARWRVHAALGDCDPVEGAVELAVAAAVEAVASVFPRACVQWCDAGVAGELGVGAKRSIGPILPSSLAALSGPQPGSASRRGASVCVRVGRSRSSSAIERSASGSEQAGRGRSAPALSARVG
jgi:hypothetical protein